jgi:hypothetical protein
MAFPSRPLAVPTVDLTSLPLRANRAYELVLFDRLSANEQEALASLKDDPECYGILRPREDLRLGVKSVSRDTALLLLSLQETGSLPRYAARSMGDDCSRVIGEMVLDGVLEVEVHGRMLSGAEASACLFPDAPLRQSSRRLASISRRAVEHGAALGLSDSTELSARLYSYNRLPATRRWRSAVPDAAATRAYLGLDGGGAALPLARGWRQLPESEAWISLRTGSARVGMVGTMQPTYKLYVSPACEWLRETVKAVADAAAQSGAVQWKVGKGVDGLLRPDKIIVYFLSFAALEETALMILTRLKGCPPHGVPFTAELGGEGLLSWGMDEPGEARAGLAPGRESWRSRICDRLALALIQAQAGASPENAGRIPAAEFALTRLQLDGIDTASWTPTPPPLWMS